MSPSAAPPHNLVLGLSGYARSGKDALAKRLIELGWTRYAFGDAMKTHALTINPWVPVPVGPSWLGRLRRVVNVRLDKLVAELGWEEAKRVPEVRRLLQEVARASREDFGQDIWTSATIAAATATPGPVVIPDVRFPSEADAIRALPGLVYRVERPGTGPANAHVSEHALEGYEFDGSITNGGTLADLLREADDLHQRLVR